MPAGKYDFYVEQGVGQSFTVQYKDGAGNPKDLTGWQGRGHIKLKMSDCVPITEMNVVVTTPLEGEIEVTLSPTAFTGTKFRTNRHDDYVEAVYDIELYTYTDGVEEVIRLLNGVVKISPEVTK